jgi:hypothetical protein
MIAVRYVPPGSLFDQACYDRADKRCDLPPLDALMNQYQDRPMDFADATLVHIAERESLSLILTIDRDDFETYRIHGRRRFRIVPSRS